MTDGLGERIKAARRRHGLSQRQLAERSGVALRTVRDIEGGRVAAPRPRTATGLLIGSGALCTVRVLGVVQIERAGHVAAVGSVMEAGILTLLAVRPGAVVPSEDLVAALWQAGPPRSRLHLVQTYVSRLRKRLAPDLVAAAGSGYRLDIDRAQADAARFLDAVAPTGEDECAVLERALREWRGPVGAGTPPGVAAHPAVVELESARVEAAVRFARLAPGHGRSSVAIELLAPVMAAHPTHPALSRAFAGLFTAAAAPEPATRVDEPPPRDEVLAVRLLGPVSATAGGNELRVAGTLGRTVLAALTVEPGRTVSVRRLIQLLWDGFPPATAREQVHTQVYRLRRAMVAAGVADVLETIAVGYRLRADRVRTDLTTATGTLAAARAAMAAGRPADAVAEYRRAEELWRGPVLGGVTAQFAEAHAMRLTEWRQDIAEERIAAALACEPPSALLPELDAMIEVHPLREELYRLRMLALHRAGRRDEALRTFGTVRTVLRRELGLDPSPALQELEARILQEGTAAPVPPGPAPVQLPPCPPGFAGRVRESAVLHRLLTAVPVSTARVAVLSGMPGIGKTALAVHAATSVAGAFPDGCLYVNLDGAADRPRATFAVLGDLLRSLGASPGRLPDDVAGRTAALRTLTAGRRVLLLLDDAADEAQVEPLLPAAPGCATVITSRSTLSGLDPSCRVNLAPLPDDDARAVLADGAGHGRIAAEPTAAGEIVRACAGMPLALRIIAARLATRPDLTVADVAARLRDEDRRLGELAAGRRSVRASLTGSYRLLSEPARATLAEVSRLGAEAVPWVVAALLDLRAPDADGVIDELVGLHMLEATASPSGFGPRFRPHDLVRVYAGAEDRTEREAAALARVVVRAVAIAAAARTALNGAAPSGLVLDVLDGHDAGAEWLRPACDNPQRWFAAEREVLLALVHAAASCGPATHAAALLESVITFLVRLNLLDELAAAAHLVSGATTGAGAAARVSATIALAQVAVHRAELPEVCRLLTGVLPELSEVDRLTQADVWSQLAVGREGCADITGAVDALHRALTCYRELDNAKGQWACHTWLARIDEVHRNRLDAAHRHSRQAVRFATALGDWRATAMALVQLGRVQLRLGDHERAGGSADAALERIAGHGDPVGEAWCLLLAADVARYRGRLDDAHRLAHRARSNAREAGRFDAEAGASVVLASVELARGDLDAARAAATEALALHDRFDSPVERLEARAMLAAVREAAGESRRAGRR